MIKCIDHIGIAVKDIDAVLNFLKSSFGAEELKRTEYPELKQISSVVNVKGTNFELMQPTAPDGPIGNFVKNSGGGYHHISIFCENLEKLVGELEGKGIKIVGKMYEGPDRVAFVHPKSSNGLLIELTDTGSRGGK